VNAGLLWGLPFALQGLAMLVDEFGCHRRRPVPRWEWLGHALDTLVFLACAAVPALLPPTPAHLRLFAGLALASCLVIGKDEWVHQRFCPAGEHWLHAVLFSLHPLVLVAMACLWTGSAPAGLATPPWARDLLRLEAVLAAGFLVLQLVHGRFLPRPPAPEIDNGLYEDLGERWYTATDDPVALLRAESRLLAGWVLAELAERGGGRPQAVLDVACGAGFLANPLAAAGHAVTGIDLSPGSLAVARAHDRTGTVNYLAMDARVLSFPDEHFDVVCMMDFLEHLDDRGAVLGEAARVLRPGGGALLPHLQPDRRQLAGRPQGGALVRAQHPGTPARLPPLPETGGAAPALRRPPAGAGGPARGPAPGRHRRLPPAALHGPGEPPVPLPLHPVPGDRLLRPGPEDRLKPVPDQGARP